VLAEEAGLAVQHGVDAFIFNHYSDGQREELGIPVTAFAGLDTKLQFALNICCHMPKRKVPFGVQDKGVAPLTQLTEAAFGALVHDLAARFVPPSAVLATRGTRRGDDVSRERHGPTIWSSRLERPDILRKILRSYGHEAYVVGLYSVAGGWSCRTPRVDELTFDAFSCYVALPDFESQKPVQAFEDAARRSLLAMQERPCAGTTIVACIGAGWNATARGALGYDPGRHGLAFPYYPVVVGDEPVAFEQYLRQAVRAVQNFAGSTRICCFSVPGTNGPKAAICCRTSATGWGSSKRSGG
jgi:hypothetical protein